MSRAATARVIPGFGLTLGYTILYLSLIVLIPLSATFLRSTELGLERFWEVVTAPRVLASLKLSFGASLLAALVNGVFGFIVAWVLVRHEFPGRKLIDALVDLPFALPTAVAGIALTALYAPNGWLGAWLEPLGLKVAFTPLGVVVALAFIGLPFVVRTLQPVLAELDRELENAAHGLGATGWDTFRLVVFPTLWPALLTGCALAFSRCVRGVRAVARRAPIPVMAISLGAVLVMYLAYARVDLAFAGVRSSGPLAIALALAFMLPAEPAREEGDDE